MSPVFTNAICWIEPTLNKVYFTLLNFILTHKDITMNGVEYYTEAETNNDNHFADVIF